jgi:Uma2 family endonuclease
MSNLLLEAETEQSMESRVVHVGERPIPFERFLDLAEGRFLELVDGVVVEIPMIQLEHERCSRWIYQVAGPFIEELGLGEMLSSRIMVKTDTFGGRMPDLLFVRTEHSAIVQPKAVYGPPDLVIEVVSPGDRPSDLRALESDYFRLGVPEVAFIHLATHKIRILQRANGSYDETIITEGPFSFTSLPDLILRAEWILNEPRPNVRKTLNELCQSQ